MKEVSIKDQDNKSRGKFRLAHWIPTPTSVGFLVLFLVCNLQCKKGAPPPNVLPPMTQEAKNTFGCKVNGEVWIPYYQCDVINFLTQCEELHTVVTNADTSGKLPFYVELTASRKIGEGSFTSFMIWTTVLKTGKFDSFFIVNYVKDSISYRPLYPITYPSNAITVTKLDTINQIISGTFNFTLYIFFDLIGDSMDVTDGRFDVKYNACLCH